MTTPDWPERMEWIDAYSSTGGLAPRQEYVLELERRYSLLRQAIVERSQTPARGINCIELLALCPALPKEPT